MALSLLLFNFSKRQESTAIPADSAGTAVDVTLKNETSLNQPVFLLSGARPNFTYAKFDVAYYFIDDIRSVRNGLYELVCSLDVLGTYRSQIQATTAFVEFAAAGHSDIMDKRVVPLSPVRQAVASGNLGISQSGCYILSVVGQDGCVQYAVTAAQLSQILTSVEQWAAGIVATATDELSILQIGFSQLMSQGNALEAVRSCRWIPFEINDLSTTPKQIYLGNYATGVTGAAITRIIKTYGVQINVPFTRTGWRRLQPYSDVFLYLPFVGVVNISNPYFQANNEVTINVSVNVVSGEIAYSVMIDSIIVGTYGGNCGASIDFGTTITPALNMVNGIFQGGVTTGIAAIVADTAKSAGAAPIAALGAAASVISSAQSALTPISSCVGGIQGGVGAGLVTAASLWVFEHDTSGAPGNMAAVQGLPYFNTARLGSLSGYVQTRGASVAGSIRGAMRERINSMLDSGIFME